MSATSLTSLTLEIFAGRYCIARQSSGLRDGLSLTESYDGDFFSVSRSADEVSLIVEQTRGNLSRLPAMADINRDWKLMRVAGQLDFTMVGIIAGLAGLLANENIPIFCVSTFNTDYILVKQTDLEETLHTLNRHHIPWVHHHA